MSVAVIQRILKQWKKESKSKVPMQYRYMDGVLEIYTTQPGWYIGKAGILGNKYIDILKSEVHDFKELKLVETEYCWY